MDVQQHKNKAYLPSFGRRHGRMLHARHIALLETHLPNIALRVEDGVLRLPAGKSLPTHAEIGFGAGEHLAAMAQQNPEQIWLGCEAFWDGMAHMVEKIANQNLHNVLLYYGDARDVLQLLPNASLARVDVLFPDPWSKQRHHKRRIINTGLLNILAEKLRPGGCLRMATDDADYSAWMLEHTNAHPAFHWPAERASDFMQPPVDWHPTRYQQKAERAGRKAVFLEYIRM